MKYNRHYKPPKASKKRAKRNPGKKVARRNAAKKTSKKSSKSATMSKDEALSAQGEGFTDLSDMTLDKRKDKKKMGKLVQLAEPEMVDDEIINFKIVDAVKKNPRRNAKSKTKLPKTQADLELENTQAILQGLASETDQLLARVAVQNIGGQIVMPFPSDPETAFTMGLYQGMEAVKKLCPTYKIPGISLIDKDAANILATIEARKKAEKDLMLEVARRGSMDRDDTGFDEYSFTESYIQLSPSQAISADLGSLRRTIPRSPPVAWQFGYNIGLKYGLEACPFKWLPFLPAFRKIRQKLAQFDQRLALEQARQMENIQMQADAQRQLQAAQLRSQAAQASQAIRSATGQGRGVR